MKYKNFLLRAVNLLLILGVLWQYQQVALVRAAAVSQRKQEIAEVEAYNASVLQAQSAAQAEQTQSGYRDGTYEGSAFGFGDVIRVSVTIQNGKMTDIAVLDASGEDKPYYKQALPLLDEMLAVQSAGWIPFPALPSRQKVSSVQSRTHWERRQDDGKNTDKAFDGGAAASAGPKAPYMAARRGAAVLLCVHAGRVRGRVFRGKADLSAHRCGRGAHSGQLHAFSAGAVRLHFAVRPFFLRIRLRLWQLG